MFSFTLISIAALLPCLLCQQVSQDPLCNNMQCPSGQVCRHVKECGQPNGCQVVAMCTDVTVGRGGCRFGDPILFNNTNKTPAIYEDLPCYNESPCPSDAYCSAILMDVGAVCCLSDPAKTNRTGFCPTPTSTNDNIWCVDGCNSDGDCYEGQKCCNTGCRRECLQAGLTPPMPPTPPPQPTQALTSLRPPAPPASSDPCNGKVCPQNQRCRYYKPCGQNEKCQVIGICSSANYGRGGCRHGEPIIHNNTGTEDYLYCYMEAPCPSDTNTYCSTVLQDIGSVCCLSDPAKTVKPGVCPNVNYNTSRYFCYDECKSDGDCSWDEKCCSTGCKMDCVRPEVPKPPTATPPPPPVLPQDPCDNKLCPANMFCRRRGQPCRNDMFCRPEGECTRCPYMPYMTMHRGFRIGTDPNGCPAVVLAEPRWLPAYRQPYRQRQISPLTYLLFNDIFNKK